MVVTTPVATIGVRGTVVGGVSGPEGTLNTITLLSDGEISVTNATGTTTLNLGAGQTLQVQSFFTDPGQPIILSTAEINNLLGGAIGAARHPHPVVRVRQSRMRRQRRQPSRRNRLPTTRRRKRVTAKEKARGKARAMALRQTADGAAGDGPPADAGLPADLTGGDEGGGGEILVGGTRGWRQ